MNLRDRPQLRASEPALSPIDRQVLDVRLFAEAILHEGLALGAFELFLASVLVAGFHFFLLGHFLVTSGRWRGFKPKVDF